MGIQNPYPEYGKYQVHAVSVARDDARPETACQEEKDSCPGIGPGSDSAGMVSRHEVFFRYYSVNSRGFVRLLRVSWYSIIKNQAHRKRLNLVRRLELAGFMNPFSYRIGSCERCNSNEEIYWDPVRRAWLCAVCFYSEPSVLS